MNDSTFEQKEIPYKGYLIVTSPDDTATVVKVNFLGLRTAQHEESEPNAVEKCKAWIDNNR